MALRRIAGPINNMLRWFASSQIRNVACLGGNLVTASPISDMNPMLAALGAKLVLSSVVVGKAGSGSPTSEVSRRKVPVSEFFLKYRSQSKYERGMIPNGVALFNWGQDRGAKESTRKPKLGTFGPIIIYIYIYIYICFIKEYYTLC